MKAKLKIYDGPIPFDKEGNQLHYPDYRIDEKYGGSWHDNFFFDDTLIYGDYGRGRSAAYFHFKRKSTGTGVTMFFTDFDKIVPHMIRGEVTGTFTFTKRGQNYGCLMLNQ